MLHIIMRLNYIENQVCIIYKSIVNILNACLDTFLKRPQYNCNVHLISKINNCFS